MCTIYIISSGARTSYSLAMGDAWLWESAQFVSISYLYGHIHMAIQWRKSSINMFLFKSCLRYINACKVWWSSPPLFFPSPQIPLPWGFLNEKCPWALGDVGFTIACAVWGRDVMGPVCHWASLGGHSLAPFVNLSLLCEFMGTREHSASSFHIHACRLLP